METLLMIAVVLIALAVVAQTGVLIGMYLMSRKLTTKAEALITDSQRLMAPIESITSNLTSVSNDLSETGKMAREQVLHIQDIVSETHDTIRGQMYEIREKVLDTYDEARDTVMRPVRQYSAFANAIAEGVRTFFGRKRHVETVDMEVDIDLENIDIQREGRNFPAA